MFAKVLYHRSPYEICKILPKRFGRCCALCSLRVEAQFYRPAGFRIMTRSHLSPRTAHTSITLSVCLSVCLSGCVRVCVCVCAQASKRNSGSRTSLAVLHVSGSHCRYVCSCLHYAA